MNCLQYVYRVFVVVLFRIIDQVQSVILNVFIVVDKIDDGVIGVVVIKCVGCEVVAFSVFIQGVEYVIVQ